MTHDGPGRDRPRDLRRVAEDLLRSGTFQAPDLDGIDLQRLVHELHVLHAELEMQNHELREAQTALEDARRRYLELFQFAPVGFALLDRRAQVVESNEAAGDLLASDRSSIVGFPFSVHVVPDDHEGFYRHVQDVFARRARRAWELRCRRRDGTVRHVLLVSSVWPHREPEDPVAITVMLDVTEQRRLEEELLQSQKMEAIGRLAGGVAHDFNNRLLVIKARAELLRLTDGLPTEVTESLDDIEQAADRAAQLTKQLLAFARRQVLRPGNVDLNQVVRRMAEMLRRLIGEHIELEVETDETIEPVLADPAQLEQVVLNLVVNARDAMPQGGRLAIRTTRGTVGPGDPSIPELSGDVPCLEVTDTGVGMTDEVRRHLFEPFFTTKAVGRGTGLGLSTVYGIVRQSGGLVKVQTAPGSGTTFRVLLPRGSTEPAMNAPRPLDREVRGGPETILVVEDEAEVRAVVERVLSSAGYRVLTAGSADAAIALIAARAEPVDLLLTDVVLPGRDGVQLADEIAARGRRIRTMFMSGHPLGTQGFTHPGRDLLVKPFTPDALLRAVRSVLDRAPVDPAR